MIPLGYELGSGARVGIPVNHTVVLGQTQLSGKTTTLEAMVARSELRAIGFITKPGEKSFRLQTQIPAFFSESTIEEYWKYVVAIVENLMNVKLGWQERGWIVKLCQDYSREGKTKAQSYKWKKPKSLRELLANVEIALPHLRGNAEMVCMQLREYLKPAVREIDRTTFSDKLDLARGINVMDITELSDGLKALVIRSVIEWVHKHGRKIVVIIPEAWKFIPEGRSTPVKLALEGLIREGAGVGNFVWMDSQDLRGVDKLLLRSVIVWLFGVQRQKNEVASTLASIPDHPKPSATEIMQLGKGEFYVCYGPTLVRTYVQPAGMEDIHAQAIARGEERPESWTQIVRSLDAESGESRPGDGNMAGRSAGDMAGDRQNHRSIGDQDLQEEAQSFSAEEETMWKEKYDAFIKALSQALGCDNEPDAVIETIGNLKRGHDHLAERIRASEEAGETVLHAPQHSAALAGSAEKAAEGTPRASISAAAINGNYDGIYRYIVDRAAREKEPALVGLLVQHPELMINVERKVISIDYETVPGAIAKLIADRFFDQPHNGYQTFLELQRRGRKCAKVTVNQALSQMAEMGFLTREEEGYRAAPGMKVTVKTLEASA
jgi:hypothetical protein